MIQEWSVPIGNQSATAVGYVSMGTSSGDQEFHRRFGGCERTWCSNVWPVLDRLLTNCSMQMITNYMIKTPFHNNTF